MERTASVRLRIACTISYPYISSCCRSLRITSSGTPFIKFGLVSRSVIEDYDTSKFEALQTSFLQKAFPPRRLGATAENLWIYRKWVSQEVGFLRLSVTPW